MSYRFDNLSILCVDDNKYMQQIYWIALSTIGCRKVIFASDGTEALKVLKDSEFDMILCDLNMAPMDGLEFLRTLRKMTKTNYFDIPVIVVSGNTERKNVAQARDAGATEFVAKPISVEELYRRISSVIENPRDFTVGGTFSGPDRRRRRIDDWSGTDRRSHPESEAG